MCVCGGGGGGHCAPYLCPGWVVQVYRYLDRTQIASNEEDREEFFRHISQGGWPFSTAAHGWPISDCTSEGTYLSAYSSTRLLSSYPPVAATAAAAVTVFRRQTFKRGFSLCFIIRAGANNDYQVLRYLLTWNLIP